jgi:hypothetical protein
MKMAKLHRILRAVPLVSAIMIIAIIAPLIIPLVIQHIIAPMSITTQSEGNMPIYPSYTWWIIALIVIVGGILIALQTWSNYRTQWYDPTLALKYSDIFWSQDVIKQRKKAAEVYKKTKKWDSSVEDILDIFEDIGFYVKNGIMSKDIAHHFFYYWIRGYIQIADGYIKEYRSNPKQQTTYEHCVPLLEELSKVEANKMNTSTLSLHLSEEDIDRFIKEEIDS